MAKQMEKNSEIASVSFEDGSNLVSHFQLAPTSTPVFKTESLKDETDALGSGSLNTSQVHPKKKGGFVITSVKDNVDGDESADDLDESHASYSDISYSRTTDHDPESSASEDTLNLTVQDGPSGNGNGQAGAMTTVPTVTAKNLKTYQAHMQTKTRYEQYPDNESDANPPQIKDGSSKVVTLAGENLPQTKPSTIQFIENRTSEQVLNGVPFNSSGCKGATPAKTLASRVYKVVKRDTQQPVKRERSRWGYFDYPDSQSPNLGFVSQSTSDSRLNYHEHSNILISMSATSVPSSTSSYSLQHSDSASSVHRDPHIPAPLPHPMQHSASASSINQEGENRGLQRLISGDTSEEHMRRQSVEDRGSEAPDHDAIKNVIQNYVDLTSVDQTSEDESASSRSGRIDNKIEAAMDLVKKHLMLAVRDEVDELKEKIVELQDDNLKIKLENEALKGILTPEQYSIAQHKISTKVKNRSFLKQTTPQAPQGPLGGFNQPGMLDFQDLGILPVGATSLTNLHNVTPQSSLNASSMVTGSHVHGTSQGQTMFQTTPTHPLISPVATYQPKFQPSNPAQSTLTAQQVLAAHQALVAQQALAAQQAVASQSTHTAQSTLTAQQILAAQQAIAAQQALTNQQPLVAQSAHTAQPTLTAQQVLVAQQAHTAQQALAAQKTLSSHQALTTQQGHVAQQALAAQQALVTQQAHTAQLAQTVQTVQMIRQQNYTGVNVPTNSQAAPISQFPHTLSFQQSSTYIQTPGYPAQAESIQRQPQPTQPRPQLAPPTQQPADGPSQTDQLDTPLDPRLPQL